MRSVDHRIDNARILGHAVDVDFDRQHARVEGGLTQQFEHVFKRVVRIIEQHIALANGVKAVAELIEPQVTQARQWFVDQVGLTDVREADKVFKVVVAAARHD